MNVQNNNELIKFFQFIIERQYIWYKRFIDKQEPPWTNDETLHKYKFCNVYRELDKGTQYIIESLPSNMSREDKLFNIVFYRLTNVFGIFKDIGAKLSISDFDRSKFEKHLDYLISSGVGLFSSAYLICQIPVNPEYRKSDKHVQITFILDYLRNNIDHIMKSIDESETPKDSFNILIKLPNVGPFLAYEIWCDLTYFNFFKQGWSDNDFLNIGPGAEWGLSIIFPKAKFKEYNSLTYLIQESQKEIFELCNLDTLWNKIKYENAFYKSPFLSIRNIEHSLCEYRKYFRLKRGLGKKKYFSYKKNNRSFGDF